MTSDKKLLIHTRHGSSFESTVSIKQLELHYVKKKNKDEQMKQFQKKNNSLIEERM